MNSREKCARRAPIKLSDHFTVGRLLQFTSASMAMMTFSSVYVVADGIFVSNFVGKTPFAALNLIYPFLQILGTVCFMLGAGGSALAIIGLVAMPFVASAFRG